MERVHRRSDSLGMFQEPPAAAAVRCSVILPPDAEETRLDAYLDRLQRQPLGPDYEIIVPAQGGPADGFDHGPSRVTTASCPAGSARDTCFDLCARVAGGECLLFVRQLVDFTLAALEASIRELETSGNELSVSTTGAFVLVRQSLYRRLGRVSRLFAGIDRSCDTPASHPTHPTVHRVRSLENESLSISCGPGSFVDPDVVVDSPERVRIGANCVIRKGVVLRAEGGEIVIGDNCVVNHYCVFHGKGGIYIGDWTIIAPHCGFYAQNHTFDRFDLPITKQPNVGRGLYLMGDNWIGAGTVVCDDVTVGKGAVIGAHATVTRSVPMAAVAVGSPARVIRKRYREDWDFHQRERAAAEGTPPDIRRYVEERGCQIAALLHPEDRVLDVGCGEGLITGLLAGRCACVVACDYSMEAVELAARRHAGVEFVYSNSTHLRFPSGGFTKVILSEVAEHLMPVQLVRTLEEIHRVLAPGGMLILTTPLTGKGPQTSTYAHIYEYSENEIRLLLNRSFTDIQLVDSRFGMLVARKKGMP